MAMASTRWSEEDGFVSTLLGRTEISGPDAAEFGPMVVGDFPDVLAALKRVAEG